MRAGVLITVLLAWSLAGCTAAAPSGRSEQTVTVGRGDVVRTATAAGALSGVAPGGGVAVVPFPEADAAAIRPGLPVRLSFDAVPGLALPGTVEAVAPDAVTISGVTEYYVTIALAGDSRLRAGQTVQASVTSATRRDVLTVPNVAVVDTDGRVAVDTPDRGRVSFTPGVVGDHDTEVRGGLTEGQRILVPSGP